MQQWVVDLCASRLGNSAFGLLAGAQRLTPSTADAVASLLAGLRPGAVASSLQRLDRPAPSATAGPLAAATGLDAELIRRWEHYRALIGEDVALPRRALALATLPSSLAAEAVAIRARFGDSHPRLATLEDPAAVASRLAAARRVVTRSLERAIAELRMRALRVLLEETARAQIGPLAARLPLRLLADLALLSGLDETERKLLGRFMESVSRGASLDAWPENVAWLSSRRFDALAWREGFDVVVDGVRYVCERDPVRALHMGTWFDTCLSLDGGFNQFAALNNTIEANRHVVYGYSAAGDVLARRLLAVTDEGVLLKYRTYAFADGAAHAAALDRLCLELAERCGLTPGVEGSPRSLTASEFYDDGTEQWAPGAPVPAAGAGTPARP